MRILAIDPGPEQSGWVLYDVARKRVLDSGVMDNYLLLPRVAGVKGGTVVAIEMIASYGMAVGKSVFETCVWIGRFMQRAQPAMVRLVYRRDVKLHLCNSPRAKDTNVRQALIDKLGPPGRKSDPGPTYGVKSHAWAALAVAVTAAETEEA